MKKRLELIVVASACVVVALFLTTRLRWAHAVSSNSQQPKAQTAQTKGAASVARTNPRIQANTASTQNVISRGAMNRVSANMTLAGLRVSAEAVVEDVRPDARFFWGCRVFSTGNNRSMVYEKLYTDQMFTMPESGKLRPTFDETLVFPAEAGTYSVQVIVFTIPPGFDLSKFRDPTYEATYRFVGGGTKVAIP